jgi:hypothetical protein
MAEVIFINDAYIKKYTQVNGGVDSNILYPSIYLAQDKYLAPLLGTRLYNKLKTEVTNNTLGGVYLTLMDDYVRKVVLWYTMAEVLPYLTYKLDNGTLVQRVSEDAQPVPDQVFKNMMDRAKVNAEYYAGLLSDYLCANTSLFPEYSNNQWPERAPVTLKQGRSAVMFSHGANGCGYGDKRYSQIP